MGGCVLSRTLKMTGVGGCSQWISLNSLDLVTFYCKRLHRDSLIKKTDICNFLIKHWMRNKKKAKELNKIITI
jgi:hypothetical protein